MQSHPENEEQQTLPISFFKGSITLISKPKTVQKNKTTDQYLS